jgi:hypothetical protein
MIRRTDFHAPYRTHLLITSFFDIIVFFSAHPIHDLAASDASPNNGTVTLIFSQAETPEKNAFGRAMKVIFFF